MVPSVGQTLIFLTKAEYPVSKVPVSDASVVFNFYAPGKNPVLNPSDRTADHGPFTATYDPLQKGYTVSVPSTGWVSGVWTYQAVFTGPSNSYVTWNYASFQLNP